MLKDASEPMISPPSLENQILPPTIELLKMLDSIVPSMRTGLATPGVVMRLRTVYSPTSAEKKRLLPGSRNETAAPVPGSKVLQSIIADEPSSSTLSPDADGVNATAFESNSALALTEMPLTLAAASGVAEGVA